MNGIEADGLTVANLDVAYGHLVAVRGLSMTVARGQIVALLGANGAGKTSVVRAVSGTVPVQRGSLSYGSRRVERLSSDRRVALGIATVTEMRDLFGSLTVAENLRMGAYRRRDSVTIKRDLEKVYTRFPVLASRRSAVASTLSGGQAQMLAIGRALMSAPTLLLLDEPSHGLAPNLSEELFRMLPELTEDGLSILLVEQNANKALEVASYGYVLEVGSLALEGTASDLATDSRVAALYLGG